MQARQDLAALAVWWLTQQACPGLRDAIRGLGPVPPINEALLEVYRSGCCWALDTSMQFILCTHPQYSSILLIHATHSF